MTAQPLSLFDDLVVDAPPTQGIKYAGSKLKLLPYAAHARKPGPKGSFMPSTGLNMT